VISSSQGLPFTFDLHRYTAGGEGDRLRRLRRGSNLGPGGVRPQLLPIHGRAYYPKCHAHVLAKVPNIPCQSAQNTMLICWRKCPKFRQSTQNAMLRCWRKCPKCHQSTRNDIFDGGIIWPAPTPGCRCSRTMPRCPSRACSTCTSTSTRSASRWDCTSSRIQFTHSLKPPCFNRLNI
jgi:hypothetical protein